LVFAELKHKIRRNNMNLKNDQQKNMNELPLEIVVNKKIEKIAEENKEKLAQKIEPKAIGAPGNAKPDNASIEDFVKRVEANYCGLGIPTLYATLSILANKSVFFIANKGVGKTRIIKSVPEVEDHHATNFDAFTYGELNDLCQKFEDRPNMFPLDVKDCQIGVKDKNLVFKVTEFSSMSEYHRQVFLTVCSKLASDGDYKHITTITPHLNFENCKLSMLIAVQPRLYSQLCNRYTQWETMATDRFTKFPLLNPLREGNTIDEPFVATLPKEIPNSAILGKATNLEKLVTLFQGQISEGRAYLYARDYIVAFARIQGKTEVSQEDIDLFHTLFSPYLQSFTLLQERADLEATITVSSGNLELLVEIGKHMEGITKDDLAKSLMVTVRHTERGLAFLSDKGLIMEQEDKYSLNNDLSGFFKWYKDTLSLANVAGE
jgi:hypothetical protein